jgi:hypothetical protein
LPLNQAGPEASPPRQELAQASLTREVARVGEPQSGPVHERRGVPVRKFLGSCVSPNLCWLPALTTRIPCNAPRKRNAASEASGRAGAQELTKWDRSLLPAIAALERPHFPAIVRNFS